MKTSKFVLQLLCLCCAPLFCQSTPQPSTTGDKGKSANVSDFSFLSGRWVGEVDKARIEQECSTTDPEVMVCMFRLMDEKGTQMLEFYTLRNTPDGVEERIRFFSADLQEKAGDPGVTMKLASFSPDKIVFENPNGTYPKRSTLSRHGNDEFNSHIELVDAQGKSSVIDAHWLRAK